ncbi:hypothetical protein PsYK624_103120 [Phanerochaete sordida]|uniref:Uncharacterized protein n=1 Tax=Phanerochaete sordida TaxID=48140 RepID=A0A9P3GID1_9APHY|nr:hypothetical protein PsYK624_103120 [Phanerochaete sordida]
MCDSSAHEQREATRISWNAPYVGNDDRILADAILDMKREANGARYKNILPIIQSSGTGKSRLAHEVAKFFVTIPMNVRPPADTTAYPVPDHSARDYILSTGWLPVEASPRHLAFWIEVFRVSSELILEFAPGTTFENEQDLAVAWRSHLEDNDRAVRKQLYGRATESAELRVERVGDNQWGMVHDSLKAEVATEGPRRLVAAIQSRLSNGLTQPDVAVLVYIDEVYEISATKIRYDHQGRTKYDSLLDAFTALGSSEPIFLLTMSTDPYVVRRTDCPILHQPAYTSLVFDRPLDGDYLFCPGTMTLSDVAQPKYMAKFGRPLFSTRLRAAEEHGFERVVDDIRYFALAKLLCCSSPDLFLRGDQEDHTSGMIFAPLSTRLLLSFDLTQSRGRNLTELLVAQHMRIAYSMPAHNDYIVSGAPSEPLLAEAARRVMHSRCKIDWLDELARAVRSGVVKHEPAGALAARTLLTFAFDAAAAQRFTESTPSFSAAVPVLYFLRALFAPAWHDTLLGALPGGAQGTSRRVSLQCSFADAFVRFTHFVSFDGGDIPDVHVALAAVARGFALVLAPAYGAVHIAVPVVMRDALLTVDVMSYIFITLQTRLGTAGSIDNGYLAEVFEGVANTHPVIHLNMYLEGGARALDEDPIDVADEEGSVPVHPCYRLAAYGCSRAVYGVIDEKHEGDYAALVDPSTLASDHVRQDARSLEYVQRMKGEWDRNEACFHWAADPVLRAPIPVEECAEGLLVV